MMGDSGFVGDWARVTALLSGRFSKRLNENLWDALTVVAETLRDEIVNTIKSGGTGWPALSPVTISLKGKSTPLIDTGNYVNSFVVVPNEDGGTIFVGVDPEATTDSGVPLSVIGRIQEFGLLARSGRGMVFIPPRPHISPAVRRIEPLRMRLVMKALVKTMKETG